MTTPNSDTQTPEGTSEQTVPYADHKTILDERDGLRTRLTELEGRLATAETTGAEAQAELKKLTSANQSLSENAERLTQLEEQNKTLADQNAAFIKRDTDRLAKELTDKGVSEDLVKDKSLEQLELMSQTIAGMSTDDSTQTPTGTTVPNPIETGVEGASSPGTDPNDNSPLAQAAREMAALKGS